MYSHVVHFNKIIVQSLMLLLLLSSQQLVFAAKNELGAEVALAFAHAYSTKDYAAMSDLFNGDEFATRIATNGGFDSALTQEYKKLFNNQAQRLILITNMFQGVKTEGAELAFVRSKNFRGLKNVPVVRANFNDGSVEYYLLDIDQNGKISDMYQMSRGNWLSSTLGQMTAFSLGQGSGFLQALGERLNLSKSALEHYQPVANAYKNGDYAQAYAAIKALPENMRTLLPIQQLAIFSASNIDDASYMEALTTLYETQGENPETAFILLDYHATRDDKPAVINSLSNAMNVIGDDAYLLNLRGAYFYASGDTQSALKDFELGIKSEPNFEDNYWSVIDIGLLEQDFDLVTRYLDLVITQLGYQISAEDLLETEGYEEYVQSDEFKARFM